MAVDKIEGDSFSLWTREQDKAFENAIATYSENDSYYWEIVAESEMGKSIEEIKQHYKLLVSDINDTESCCVHLPCYTSSSYGSSNNKKGGQFCNFDGEFNRASRVSRSEQERRKGVAWTEKEHRISLGKRSFCNAYGTSLTDINMAYNYARVGLSILAALAWKQHGVVEGLVECGIMTSVIFVSCILMQDLKIGHLMLTSPRAMLASQTIGTTIGCIVFPLSFSMFYKAFDVGNLNGEYKVPYVIIYKNMAILRVEGFSALPNHCRLMREREFVCNIIPRESKN